MEQNICYNYKCDRHIDRMNPVCVEPECRYVAKKESLIGDIFMASDSIKNGRTIDDVLAHLMTEVGELAQEVIIEAGRSHKKPGADGIVGEALDVINCAVDLIRQMEPHMTEDELREKCALKLNKWKSLTFMKETK